MRRATLIVRLMLGMLGAAGVVGTGAAHAAQEPEPGGRFAASIVADPATRLGVVPEKPEGLPGYEAERAAWEGFRSKYAGWDVHVDRRSGTPLLAEGGGVVWVPAGTPVASVAALEARAREFVVANRQVLRVNPTELVLDELASGPTDEEHWAVVFNRQVRGIPVEGEQLAFYVNYGNLVAFGANRWGAIRRVHEAALNAEEALGRLHAHMGLGPAEAVEQFEPAQLLLTAVPPSGALDLRYTGTVGRGVDYRLVWRVTARIAGEIGSWVAKVDAVTGEIVAFYDDNHYAQVQGGIYGLSPADPERPGYPMPYTDVDVNSSSQYANDAGVFACSGDDPVTNLAGQYILISDGCGTVYETADDCDTDNDLGSGSGTDCVSQGTSPGDTHAARTAYYHANRVLEKARRWSVPGTTGLQVTASTNTYNTPLCNAFGGAGGMSFYEAEPGCRNTGEVPSLIHHESGHVLDYYDGGGWVSPGEAYGDVVAILERRRSCVAEGVYYGNCNWYGDPCLDCTGYREMDFTKRESALDCQYCDDPIPPGYCAQCEGTLGMPATPANWIQNNCLPAGGGGSGPCGRQVHCESFVPSEAVFDLATRDLPGMGLDAASAWQLTERLFYKSRGGVQPIYTCALPSSSGCSSNSWYSRFRVIDDDDGDLRNGTPHAAAIFAAFDRHAIACNSASDSRNQNSSSCPTLATPVLSGTSGSTSTTLNWDSVAGAAIYRVFRSDFACAENSSFNIEATIGDSNAVSHVDTDVPGSSKRSYRLQALTGNPACESAVSNCLQTCNADADCSGLVPCAACVDGTCQTSCPSGETCVEELDQCIGDCPNTWGCGDAPCHKEFPPECDNVSDTGEVACFVEETLFDCPHGSTVHTRDCDCDGYGYLCIAENRELFCD